MFCKYCGIQLDNDVMFCFNCGKRTQKSNSKSEHIELDKKTKIIRSMAKRYLVSGILFSIMCTLLLMDNFFFDLADSHNTSYCFILAFCNAVFTLYNFIHRRYLLNIKRNSLRYVITWNIITITFCVGNIVLICSEKLNLTVIDSVVLMGIVIYEIVGKLVFALKYKNIMNDYMKNDEIIPPSIFAAENKELTNSESDISGENNEVPSKWDDILRNQIVEAVDENEYFYRRYSKYSKAELIEILERAEDYQEIAIKAAKYVYYEQYCLDE